MDKISILGGKTLEGTITISGSKNAALPILVATNIGNAAFLDPLIVIVPSSVFPPRIEILSITI